MELLLRVMESGNLFQHASKENKACQKVGSGKSFTGCVQQLNNGYTFAVDEKVEQTDRIGHHVRQ
jgi:hypothetical protein